MNTELQKILDTDEKVMWEGSPTFVPFVFQSTILLSIVGLFFLGIALFWTLIAFFMVAVFAAKTNQLSLLPVPFFGSPFVLVGFGLAFGFPIYRALVFKYTKYAITDKRVIIQSGLVGRDFVTVDFDKITNAEVNVGIFDKLFGNNSGSINISTPGTFSMSKYGAVPAPYQLANIEDPYTVFKFFKKVSYDVKTDIEYPNKLRPDTNPGYKTEYAPEIKAK